MYNDQTIMVKLNSQETKIGQHNITLIIIILCVKQWWYKKEDSNPLGVIQITQLGMTPELTNYGKITTGGSLV